MGTLKINTTGGGAFQTKKLNNGKMSIVEITAKKEDKQYTFHLTELMFYNMISQVGVINRIVTDAETGETVNPMEKIIEALGINGFKDTYPPRKYLTPNVDWSCLTNIETESRQNFVEIIHKDELFKKAMAELNLGEANKRINELFKELSMDKHL